MSADSPKREGHRWEMRWLAHTPKIEPFEDEEYNELLRDIFESEPPSLALPVMWWPKCDGENGPPVADPTTLHLDLPLSAEINRSVYEITLANVVEDLIDVLMDPTTGTVTGAHEQKICRAVAKRLREHADRVEAVIDPVTDEDEST